MNSNTTEKECCS